MNDRIAEIQAERPTATGERYEELTDELTHLIVRIACSEYEGGE